MKMTMTYEEFQVKYDEIQLIILAYTADDGYISFRSICVQDMTEDDWYALTQGGDNFRAVKRNKKWLESLNEIAHVPFEEIDRINEENFGYKAEVWLFGKANHTTDLIDGYYYGMSCQLKTSRNIPGNGTSNSHKF
jgi:hypothetical protein